MNLIATKEVVNNFKAHPRSQIPLVRFRVSSYINGSRRDRVAAVAVMWGFW